MISTDDFDRNIIGQLETVMCLDDDSLTIEHDWVMRDTSDINYIANSRAQREDIVPYIRVIWSIDNTKFTGRIGEIDGDETKRLIDNLITSTELMEQLRLLVEESRHVATN